MRKLLTAAVMLVLGTLWLPALAQDLPRAATGVTCRAYLVYEADSARLLASYHPEVSQPIASLTKLMTAIRACERLRFDGRYILTKDEQAVFGVETMRADKMLDLMLVPSNNNVCRVVARIAAGGEAGFVKLMNARAAQLGMRDTHFVNASGLPAEGQYSTPHDVLLLALTAARYPALARAMSQPSTELNGHAVKGTLCELYKRLPGLQGGKTGYTHAAGRCLVLFYHAPAPSARNYVIVSLGSRGVEEGFDDAERILDYYGLTQARAGALR